MRISAVWKWVAYRTASGSHWMKIAMEVPNNDVALVKNNGTKLLLLFVAKEGCFADAGLSLACSSFDNVDAS